MTFLDVGQGDSTLLETPSARVLVDEGPPEADVAGQLARIGVRSLSAIVMTHPQRDHVGGAADVIRRLRVREVLEPGLAATGPESEEALGAARARDVRVEVVRAGTTFRVGGLVLNVLWPADAGTPSEDPNQNAVVLVASYGETDVFLSADAESDVTSRLPLGAVEIMKVAHHGSEDPGLADELRTLRPRVAVDLVRPEQRLRASAPRDPRGARGSAGPPCVPHRPGRPRRHRVRRPEPDGPERPLVVPPANRAGSKGAPSKVADVADAPDKPVYLITGSDRPKVDTAIARLRGHFDVESIESVSALDTSGDAAVGLCNAGSLFGDARLIVVADVDGAKQTDGRRKGGWKAADVEAVSAYISSPAPATVLALVAEELKSSSALWKACAKAGTVLPFDVVKKELHGWVAEQFRQRGARAEPEAVAALIQLVGDDPRTLKGEVDKIATWAGDEPVGEREVEALVPSNADVPIYELTEAWSVRDPARALDVCETIFEHDPKPRRDVAPRLAGSLASHLVPAARPQAARGRGSQAQGGRRATQAAPVPGTEAVRAGGGLLRRGARRCGATPRRARRCAERAEQARPRPRGPAHARCAEQAPFLTHDLPRQPLRRNVATRNGC